MASQAITPQSAHVPYANDSAEPDISILLDIMRHKKWLIIGVFLTVTFLAFMVTARLTPQFVSVSDVMITDGGTQNGAPVAVDITVLRSVVEILQSAGTARRFLEDNGLYQDEEIGGDAATESFDDIPVRQQEIIVKNFMKRMAVKPVLGTALIEVSYQSANPLKAAKIANAMVAHYQGQELAQKQRAAKAQSDLAHNRLQMAEQDMQAAQKTMDLAGLEGVGSENAALDSRLLQMDVLANQLRSAQDKAAELQMILARERSDASDVDTWVSDDIQSYRDELLNLRKERAVLGQKYGENHPSMQENEREIAAVQSSMTREMDAIYEAAQTELDIVEHSIQQLVTKMDSHRQSYIADGQTRRSARDMQRTLDLATQTYEQAMADYRAAQYNMSDQVSSLQVVSRAVPPVLYSYPPKTLIIVLCGMTGLLMGVFCALLIGKAQDVIYSVPQLQRMTGLSVYSALPFVKGLKTQNSATYIADHADSYLAELLRSLYITLQLRHPKTQAGGRVVTMTSTTMSEGKTTISIWLASIAATSGGKVLIVDADMRQPSLHKKYDIGNARGLADYLSDRLPLDDVIYRNHPSGIHLMTSKALPTHALTLLTGERMPSLIRRLRDMYDVIIIDAPASSLYADAKVLGQLSDHIFYVVESQKTRGDSLKTSLKQFSDAGQGHVALIMNKENQRKTKKI